MTLISFSATPVELCYSGWFPMLISICSWKGNILGEGKEAEGRVFGKQLVVSTAQLIKQEVQLSILPCKQQLIGESHFIVAKKCSPGVGDICHEHRAMERSKQQWIDAHLSSTCLLSTEIMEKGLSYCKCSKNQSKSHCSTVISFFF